MIAFKVPDDLSEGLVFLNRWFVFIEFTCNCVFYFVDDWRMLDRIQTLHKLSNSLFSHRMHSCSDMLHFAFKLHLFGADPINQNPPIIKIQLFLIRLLDMVIFVLWSFSVVMNFQFASFLQAAVSALDNYFWMLAQSIKLISLDVDVRAENLKILLAEVSCACASKKVAARLDLQSCKISMPSCPMTCLWLSSELSLAFDFWFKLRILLPHPRHMRGLRPLAFKVVLAVNVWHVSRKLGSTHPD